MNNPAYLNQLYQLLVNQIQENALADQVTAGYRSFLAPWFIGMLIALLVSALLLFLFLATYRPRIPRGAIWIPAYGFFGGTPKIYYHTRPSSWLGIYLPSQHRMVSAKKLLRYRKLRA
jgi:hypothetical protein